MKTIQRFSLLALAFSALMFNGAAAASEAYPERPIRMVVPYPPGGGVDAAARITAQKLTESLGKPVIVENRPGAGGNIAMEQVARSAPDGYTLIMTATGPGAINASLYPSLPFDPLKSFTPVARVASTVFVIAVSPSLGVKTMKEFLELAKAKPGQLSYASVGTGATSHLAVELLKQQAGVDILHVPYKGTGPAVSDLLGGHVSMMFVDAIAAAPHLKSGTLVGLAVTSPQRNPAVPDLPTVAESGLKGFATVGWTGLLAPAGTPPSVIQKLNAVIVKSLPLPEVKEKLAGDGSEFGDNTPEEFSAFLKQDIDRWAEAIKVADVKPY